MHPDKTPLWNYSDEDALGPNGWPKYFQTGDSQSPINIIVDHCCLHPQNGVSRTAHHHHHETHKLHEQLARKLTVSRRDHLDSTGNDTNDSAEFEEAADQRRGLSVTRQDRRSASASSNHSASSNESNTSIEHHRRHQGHYRQDRQHHHYHHHHHQSTKQRHAEASSQVGNPANSTRYCGTNKKIFLGYPRYLNSVKLSNTGHGWQIDMPAELASHTLVTGPPLGDREYRLAQFHCHWGEDCEHGSEHQVNGQSFSAEIHFVHWNCSQYESIAEAGKNKHGLAVLGVFLQALDGEQNRNKHLDKIIAGIEAVKDRPHISTRLSDFRLDLKKLFPSNRWNYATYEGSLTTPPLSECVDWLVFLQPVTCSTSQIAQFRRIACPQGTLIKNCRPVQPINKRTVTIWTHHSDLAGGC